MQDLEKIPNITIEDFESFSVGSSWGGNAGNAGLKKISKYHFRGLFLEIFLSPAMPALPPREDSTEKV